MKNCIKCDHCRDFRGLIMGCAYNVNSITDHVYGGTKRDRDLEDCGDNRNDENKCGVEGKWFKKEPSIFSSISNSLFSKKKKDKDVNDKDYF